VVALIRALRTLIRCHEAHPEWYAQPEPPNLRDAEIEAALDRIYGPADEPSSGGNPPVADRNRSSAPPGD
jgi:hypothetical protein